MLLKIVLFICRNPREKIGMTSVLLAGVVGQRWYKFVIFVSFGMGNLIMECDFGARFLLYRSTRLTFCVPSQKIFVANQ